MPEPAAAVSTSPSSPRRGSPISAALAWLIILACCGHVIWEGNRPLTDEEAANVPLQLSLAGELTAKLCVGLGEWSPDVREMILDQARALEQEGRLGKAAKAVLAAELIDLEQARVALAEGRVDLPNEVDPAKREALQDVFDVLDRLYAVPSGDTESAPGTIESDAIQTPASPQTALSPDERALLETHLGWVGRLAPLVRPLAEGTPQRESLLAPLRKMPAVMLGFLAWLGVCLLGGLAALIALLVLGLRERLRHGLRAPGGSGAIYAEVFAVWIAVFVGGKIVAEKFLWSGIGISLVLTIGALILALAWAKVRGVAWRQMRQDLGLHAGRGIVVESLAGVMTYVMAIPMLLVGLLLTLGLMAIQSVFTPEAQPPSHPVQEIVTSGDWKIIMQAMVLAAIVAPIVEETIFRGALYRHLRDGTWKMGLVGSFAIAAGVSSVLFAAIHPQGWPFIPVLASLALAFCLAREWRGSLLPGMVAHGMNNFVIMTLNVLLLGS